MKYSVKTIITRMSPFLLFIEHAFQVVSGVSQAIVLLMQISWQVPLFKN